MKHIKLFEENEERIPKPYHHKPISFIPKKGKEIKNKYAYDYDHKHYHEFIAEEEPVYDAIVKCIDDLRAKGLNPDEIYNELMGIVSSCIEGDKQDLKDAEDDENITD